MKKKAEPKPAPVTISDVLEAVKQLTTATKEGFEKIYKQQKAGKF
jgi:hypothetical protein